MPWERKFDEGEVLEKAMHAFWQQGYDGTSMKNLVDCMGLNPGSIYAAFGDKRTLFHLTLERYRAQARTMLAELEEHPSPRAAIVSFFQIMADNMRGGTEECGCFLVNSSLEVNTGDEEINRTVHDGQDELEDFFRRMITAGQEAGEIGAGLDAGKTARLLTGLVSGARVLARGRPDHGIVDDMVDHVDSLLG